MNRHIYNIQIRVLICKEDGEYVARALEMDLLGYGKSELEAVEDLKSAVEAQISFARQMNDEGLISFPAEKSYFDRWEEAQMKAMRMEVLEEKSVRLQAIATFITFSKEELKALREKQFQKSNLVCA